MQRVVNLWERWSRGASVCAYFAFVGLLALGATALCAAVWIFPYEWMFGELSNEAARDGFIATAIVVVPILVSRAVEIFKEETGPF